MPERKKIQGRLESVEQTTCIIEAHAESLPAAEREQWLFKTLAAYVICAHTESAIATYWRKRYWTEHSHRSDGWRERVWKVFWRLSEWLRKRAFR